MQKHIDFYDNNKLEHTIHLSKKERIKYLENELQELRTNKRTSNRSLSSKQTKINQLYDNHKPHIENFLFDKYKHKHYQILLLEIMPILEKLANNKALETVHRYVRSLNRFIQYLIEINSELSSLGDISKGFMLKLHGDVMEGKHFKKAINYQQRGFVYSIISNLLRKHWDKQKSGWFKILTMPIKIPNPNPAYSIDLAKIILASAWFDIQKIMNDFKEYQTWKKEFSNKEFYSIKNLCYTYLISKHKSGGGRLAFLKKVAMMKFNLDLKSLSDGELKQKSLSGCSVVDFSTKKNMAWFIESELTSYPYKGLKMNSYADYFTNVHIRSFMTKYGEHELVLFHSVLHQKIPFSDNIYPFYLFILLSIGLNVDTLNSWKYKELKNDQDELIGEERYPLDLNHRVIWGLKKKTSTYIMTVLDTKEKNGIWQLIKFLKIFLESLQNKNTSNYLWIYMSQLDSIPMAIDTNTIKVLSSSFCKKYNISIKDGKPLKYIEHLRLRPTRVAFDLLKGESLNSIKERILRHKDDDTIFNYTNSPEYKSVIDLTTAAMQETLLSEAGKFEGEINTDSEKELFPADTNLCENPYDPNYNGARELKKFEICFNYDRCLLCSRSRVFNENIPRIIEKIYFYIEEKDRMDIPSWLVNYEELYDAAIDCLERFIQYDDNSKEIKMAKNMISTLKDGDSHESA